MRRSRLVLTAAIACAFAALSQVGTRSVHGIVADQNGRPLKGVPVQLKDLRSLQIRSFLTEGDGRYYFHELRTDIDYELQAKDGNHVSSTKLLSRFDSSKDAEVNFAIDTGG